MGGCLSLPISHISKLKTIFVNLSSIFSPFLLLWTDLLVQIWHQSWASSPDSFIFNSFNFSAVCCTAGVIVSITVTLKGSRSDRLCDTLCGTCLKLTARCTNTIGLDSSGDGVSCVAQEENIFIFVKTKIVGCTQKNGRTIMVYIFH